MSDWLLRKITAHLPLSARWRIAHWLDRSDRTCWANLATWAHYNDLDGMRMGDDSCAAAISNQRCRRFESGWDSCYCGKVRDVADAKPLYLAQFDLVGLTLMDDGDDSIKFDIPMSPETQAALANLVAMGEVAIHVLLYATPRTTEADGITSHNLAARYDTDSGSSTTDGESA